MSRRRSSSRSRGLRARDLRPVGVRRHAPQGAEVRSARNDGQSVQEGEGIELRPRRIPKRRLGNSFYSTLGADLQPPLQGLREKILVREETSGFMRNSFSARK